MQISKVSEVAGCEEGCAGDGGGAPEYQTASELFDLMTKNTQFDMADEYTLSAEDLVLLYQNIDIGTRLMNNASDGAVKKPNQYVETVVYNDDHDTGSDCSEVYTPNDIQDVFMINQERLDFLNDKSIGNLLCHKVGGVKIHTSNVSFDYDKSFLFQDPYIKNQLQSLNFAMGGSSEFDNFFSTSLIDYICCKRLEDNYNFYMDNIIRYVQHTIEQLKRISNGDYLTDRTREKWMEVNSDPEQEDNTKVLATSTSIPLHVECKAKRNATWDDIVHSEVDVRSLSKILEKKIIVEIPKVICGSYKLYSKRCADNLIISCHREQLKLEAQGQKKSPGKGEESRVDVVLQLQRSQTGQVISNISSIMVLKTTPALPDIHAKEILPLPYKEETDEHTIQHSKENSKEPAMTVIQLIRDPEPNEDNQKTEVKNACFEGVKGTIVEEILEANDDYQNSHNDDSYGGTNDYPFSDRIASYSSIQYSSESSIAVKDSPVSRVGSPVFQLHQVEEKTYNLISPDELHMTMRRLNMQNTVLNETCEDTGSQCTSKRRSPVRVRIKSPYENKSLLMEEKKRKRLLEIREKRERKKIALSESCKITKHKYGKGAMMPVASNSVTKLSITNKSFYNSIYGHNTPAETKPRPRKPMKNAPEVSLAIDEAQEDLFESPALTPTKNSKKYINRSYYLDEAETEMMYMQMKNENNDTQNPCSGSESNVSNEFNASLEILKELMVSSQTNLIDDSIYVNGSKLQGISKVCCSEEQPLMPIEESTIPLSTDATPQNNTKKNSSSDECRKSIDQLYDLMNKFGKPNVSGEVKAKHVDLNISHIQKGSESVTIIKPLNAASDSPGRSNVATLKLKPNRAQATGSPKVTINSRLKSPNPEIDKKSETKKDRSRRTVVSPTFKGPLPNNPLKAISQLLHDFDSVQKNRQRPSTETKPPKKGDTVVNDVKTYSRQGSFRRKSRIDQHMRDDPEKKAPPININIREKKRPMNPLELARTPHKVIPVEDKNLDKISPKKIADIIDEAKEARGEAVRGPKNSSRLNSLAQPKKSYVMAHHEQYQNRYGRNGLAERLQKLASTSAPAAGERNVSSPTNSSRNRWRRNGTEASAAAVKQRAPSVPQIDPKKSAVSTRKRRSASSSPEIASRVSSPRRSPARESSDVVCKMVAVESYVHSHYGEPSLPAGLRCRVPFLPHDLDLASLTSNQSVDETERGPAARRAVASLGSTPPPRLAALAECAESTARLDPARSESDYCMDILEDCHVTTAVSALHAESFSSYCHHANSIAEMEQLETALYSHISGTFQKRLRLKNLTLTPKSSTQQMFLLQSGDAGTMLVKSLSNVKLKPKSAESLHDLKAMPVLSNSHLDWSFAHLPVQIATVGYAFPEHRSQNSGSKAKLFEMSAPTDDDNVVERFCQSSQCLRGPSPMMVQDSCAQVDVVTQFQAELDTMSVGSVNHAANGQMFEIEPTVVNETQVGIFVTVNQVESANESRAHKVVEETDNIADETLTLNGDGDSASKVALSSPLSPSPDAVSYTTSLDMLVGLLTEIQKITCQNQMATSHHTCADFEASNKTITVKKVETARELISLTSLENLRQLESNASIYSYYLSNFEGSTTSVEPLLELKRNSRFTEDSFDIQPLPSACVIKQHVALGASNPNLVDKGVSADLWEGHTDTCTSMLAVADASSVHCGTSASAVCVLSSPSSRSELSVEHRTPRPIATRTSLCKKIIELPQIETDRRALISPLKTDSNKQCFNTRSLRKIEDIKKDSLSSRGELRYCVKNIDLDPMFNIKRDLLVSMYSILVLTVFAALSFPELLIFE